MDNSMNSRIIQERSIIPDHDFPSFAVLRSDFDSPEAVNPMLTGAHFHNLIEAGLCISGSGVAYVEDKPTPYKAGDVMVIPAYITHYTHDAMEGGEPHVWEYFYFDIDVLLHPLFPDGFPLRSLFMFNNSASISVCAPNSNPVIYNDLSAILDEMRYKREQYRLNVMLTTAKLLVDISRELPNHEAGYTPHSKLSVMPAIIYIRDHFNEEIYVEKLASLCFMSPASFRRKFKESTGHTALETVNNYRILKACEYLSHTDMPIAEISEKVGFDSMSGFGRRFADIMGSTPLKWRMRARKHAK